MFNHKFRAEINEQKEFANKSLKELQFCRFKDFVQKINNLVNRKYMKDTTL